MLPRQQFFWLLLLFGLGQNAMTMLARAGEARSGQNSSRSTTVPSPAPQVGAATDTGQAQRYQVRAYAVAGSPLLSTNITGPLLSQYIGPDIGLKQIARAASALQTAYRRHGYPTVTVAFAPGQITNGILTLNVAQTVIPQIMISGERYLVSSNAPEVAANASTPRSVSPSKPPRLPVNSPVAGATTNNAPLRIRPRMIPAGPAEMARVLAALHRKIARLNAKQRDTRIYVVSTNAGPRFTVEKYLIEGNTLLPSKTLGAVITNIVGAFGTNVSFDAVQTVVTELGKAYRERGYVTVSVKVPQQKLTHATVKLKVLEGRLAAIEVVGNHYFSSNNVMRALPSLHTNTVLNGPIFNAELNRANANQDRQIYPVISPGPKPGTSKLTLNVKDRLPLHGKLEFDNQNSPGTPDLRVNSSLVYNNLWQEEHSLGVQYGFSPEAFKQGNPWNFYDRPEVAYYSAFYRLPLGSLPPLANVVANNPGTFGYNEATRQFRLPPPSGRPELNLYASRATIDTGVQTLLHENLISTPTRQLIRQDVQHDVSVNETVGFRFTKPLPQVNDVRSVLSAGLDYKVYSLTDSKTNLFVEYSSYVLNGQEHKLPPTYTRTAVPTTHPKLDYLPLALDYHASLKNALGPVSLGLGLSANLWYSGSTSTNQNVFTQGLKSLQGITGSGKSTGHWVIIKPSFSQQLIIHTNWITTFRADGQWASEPLISTEQYGVGGVNSVPGYHEGEVFGDTGWHVGLEQQTPAHLVGQVRGGLPLTIRGSLDVDYGRTFLMDPKGRPSSVALCSTGFGISAALGSYWQAQFLFSMPLLSTQYTPKYQPVFNFALAAQF